MKAVLLFLIWLASETAMAQRISPEEIEKLRREIECADRLEDTSSRYFTMAKSWFTNQSSKANIASNFRILVNYHNHFFDLITGIDDRPSPRTQDELVAALKDLDGVHTEVIDKYKKIADTEETFLRSLGAIDSGLVEVGQEFQFLLEHCSSMPREEIAIAQEIIKNWRKEMARAGDYVAQSSIKRRGLFKVAWTSRRISLIKEFAAKTDRSLATLQHEIDSVLAIDSVYNEFNRWWHRAAVVYGLGRGLSSRYLQYHSAIRELTLDLAEIDAFLDRVTDIDPASETAAIVRRDIMAKRKAVKNELERIQNIGWRGQIDKQRRLSLRRLENTDLLSTTCRYAVESYLAVPAENPSIDEVIQLEALFQTQVDTCSGDNQ